MKVNRNGRECPQWCTEDHQKNSPFCEGPRIGTSCAFARLDQECYKDTPNLGAWVVGNGRGGEFDAAHITVENAYGAASLANALHIIAGMRKPEIRALAANVEKAAAEAWPEKEEAEAG